MAFGDLTQGGAAVGVIGLDTAFTKIRGHIRNVSTFDFPVTYRVVTGASPRRVVTNPDPALLQPFIEAARDLEATGVGAITSACGFLALFQQELADAVSVPLYSSSLIQVPMVHRMIRRGHKVGLLVASEQALTQRHLAAVGAENVPVCVAGLAGQPEFREVILEGQRPDLNVARLELELRAVVDRFAAQHPEMGAIVVECTDLVPFSYAIQDRTGLPVFDIVTLTEMVYRTLNQRPYPVPAAAVAPEVLLADTLPAEVLAPELLAREVLAPEVLTPEVLGTRVPETTAPDREGSG